MKRIKIVMATAIVLAIGSGFTTKASVNRFLQLAYRQDSGVCIQTTTECAHFGANICTEGTYQIHQSNSTCSVPFLKRP